MCRLLTPFCVYMARSCTELSVQCLQMRSSVLYIALVLRSMSDLAAR